YVPKGRPVKLLMTSEDVIHSFYMPNMRLKQDVVPGMYTYISFQPTLLGEHPIYCSMYCGTGHSNMLGKVVVLEPEAFDQWFATGKLPSGVKLTSAESGAASGAAEAAAPTKSLADKGKDVFASKGCFACHSVDGTAKVGPSLFKAYGREEQLESGSKVTV